MDERELLRAEIQLGEAVSAVTRSCWVLGERRTNQILKEINSVMNEVITRREALYDN